MGNFVGTNSGGVLSLPNGMGIGVITGAAANTIGGVAAGSGNLVAFNTFGGIDVSGSGTGNSLLRNLVQGNGLLEIDVGAVGLTTNDAGDADTGANDLQNFPVLASANSTGGDTTVTGSFNSNASTNYRIEFFSAPVADGSSHGGGAVFLGSTTVSTDLGGNASIGEVLVGVSVSAGHVVTATATVDLGGGNYGSTSEFAANVTATAVPAGISVGAISGNTTEAGGTATFTVVLDTAPLADVTVPVSSSNTLEGTVSTALLTFTTANWGTPQTVTVTGQDDTLDDGDHAYSVVLGAASSADAAYNGVNPADVAATNTDNDNQNTVQVTSTSDTADGDTSSLYALLQNKGADGQVSLREAITAANNTANGAGGADRIQFTIAGSGVHVLNVATALPDITGAVIIDATTEDSYAANANRPAIVLDGNDGLYNGLVLGPAADGSTVKGLVIRDFGFSGIWVQAGSDNHTISGNYVGALDAAGAFAAGEGLGLSGVYIEGSGSTIGGTTVAQRNVIAGAGNSGVWLQTGSSNLVVGNFIGLAADGVTVIGNAFDGVTITTGSGNRIGGTAAGEGNRIAGSADDGIEVSSGTGNALLGNLITGSGSLAIDLGINDSTPLPNDAGDADSGGNNLQNYPVLTVVRTDGSGQLTVTGLLDTLPSTAYRVELYANTAAHASGHGEGQRFLGYVNVTTDGAGFAGINASLAVSVAVGEFVSATATSANAGFTVFGDTSEFALNTTATLAPVVVTTVAPLAYAENDAATPLDAALTVSDGDSANLVGAVLMFSGSFVSGQDTLQFTDQLGITGSWDAGTGVLTLTGSAPVADYQTALRSVAYINTSDAPSTAARTVYMVVHDGVAPGASVTRGIAITAVNDAPTATTSGSTLSVAENSAATVVDTGLVLADVDNASLSGASVSISVGYVNGQDLLLFTDQLGITGSWNASTGVLTLAGSASVANYQAALRSVSYLNNSEAPDVTLRTLSFDVSDGTATSAVATRFLQVTAVNDAPVLDNSAAMLLTTIARTNNTNPGNTVAQVIGSVSGDRITDVDSAALEGVAITSTATAGLGVWEYSLDGGSSWAAVGAVNSSAALVLRDTDRIRFVPSGVANGQAALTFRAWDQSSGSAGSKLDASTAGGTQPFSTALETATINVVENTGGPVAVDDSAQTQVGAAVPVNVTSNDLDPQGNPLVVLDVSNPANGTLALAGNTITYSPGGGFSGTDTFNYLVSDGNEGLTHYWKLDGNAVDSVAGSNGTLVNGPSTVAGPYGSALQFDGVDDHVLLPDQTYTNEFSLSFRFRVDDNSGSQIQYFYSHGPSPSSGLRGMVHVGMVEASNAVLAQRNNLITTVFDNNDETDGSGQLLVDVAALIGDGQWHQYTATVTPGIGTRVYLDGALRGSVNRGGDAIDPTGGAYLGARSDLDPTRYLNAGSRMDSLALFNRALSATEVSDFWTGGNALATVTVDVNAVPVVATSGGSLPYTENAAATAVDSALTVSDANSATLASAVVSISGNYVAGQDQLQFSNQLGISGSWNVGTGELTLTGNATVANYQTALRSVVYLNSSDAPSTLTRTVSFVVNDGLANSAAASRNVALTAVNDAPTAASLNSAESYTEDTPLNLVDIVISDVDSSSGSATLTLSNPAAGTLSTGTSGAVTATYNAGTGVWNASGALADVNALLSGLSFTPALNFNGAFSVSTSVSDGVAAPVTGSKAFTGVAVNDAPTASNLNTAQSTSEDVPLNLAAIVVADVDSATVTVTLTLSDAAAGGLNTGTSGAVSSSYGVGTGVWTASGAIADVNALLAALVFTPASNYIGAFTITTSVSDGVAAPLTGSQSWTVTPVNDAPSASNLNAAESYTEDLPLNLTDSVVSDVDSANVTATFTLSNTAAGSLSTATAGAVTSSFNPATGVWTASGALADVNTLLAGLVFTPTADFNGAFSINTSVDDLVAAPITGSKLFTGTPVNDAPTASNLNAAESYTEDTPLNLVDLVVADIDSASGSATLVLSNVNAGTLSTGTAGAATSTYNPSTGVWTASGSWADVNTLLAGLVFTPTADFNGGFSISTSLSDGVAAPVSGSKLFSGVPVNDAPTASGLNTAENYTEDQPLNLAAIVVSDIDSASISATLTLSNAAAGALGTATAGAVTSSFNPATGVWTASGALADVNTLLAGLVFTPTADFNGAFSITTSVDDGVAAPITGSKLFTCTPVNDAPTASNLNAAETYTEDTPLNLVDLVVADIDSASGSATLVLSNVNAGTLSTGTAGAATSSYNPATGVWTASGSWVDVNTLLAGLVFTPTADFNGGFSISSSLSDGVAAPVSGSKLFTGVPVNDAPTASGLNTAENYTEDQPLNLAAIVVGDIDSASISATLTLSNAAAGALGTATAGAVTSSFNPATGVWTASGALADVNALLAGLVFTPTADFNGAFSINTSVNDGVAAPITGSKLFTGTPVNDAPTASNLNAAESYTEDTPLNLIDIVAADIDSANLTVTLTLSDPSVGLLSGGASGAVNASFNATTGVWSASGLTADVNALLASVTFTPALNFNGAFSISTQVDDGVAAPVTGLKNVSAVAVNDAPTATGLNTPETYTEDTPLLLAPVVVSDLDGASGSATLVLSDPTMGRLSTGSAGTTTSSYDASTGVWTASGNLADVNALLASTSFVPALNVNGSFSISTRVSDGTAAPLLGQKDFTGLPVNDAPTATGLNTPQTYTEDTPLALDAIVISDIDSANVSATLVLSDPSVGSLSATAPHHGGSVVFSFDAATGSFTASGALADVNGVLTTLRFTPALNTNGSFNLATQVSDGLAAPVGGSRSFTGLAVNDAPLLATPAGLQVAEGSAAPLTAAQLHASDVDNSSAELVYTLLQAPAHGWLLRAGAALTPGATFTQADVDAGRVAYQHDASETTQDSFELSLADALGAPAPGGAVQVNIGVMPVNDETPRITNPLPASSGAVVLVPENTRPVTTVTASDADLPAQTLQFQIAGGADAAFFSIDAATGDLQFITAPDFEQPQDADHNNLYQLDLRVLDGTLSSVHSITVAVAPVNDNAPTIVSSGAQAGAALQVQEGDSFVVTVLARDADQPAQAMLYSIAGGADAALFAVDPHSGALRFVAAPAATDPRDSNRDNLYEVVLQASDGQLTAQQQLQVQVRAAVLPGAPGNAQAPGGGSSAPLPYTGDASAPLPVRTADAVVPADLAPLPMVAEEQALQQWQADSTRTVRNFKLIEQAGVRSAHDDTPAAAAQAAGGADPGAAPNAYVPAPDADTRSLEAALGLPTTDAGLLQARPGGLSLAALAAQAAVRSSTAVPSGLVPAGQAGDGGVGEGDENPVISAIATPVVAGGVAFSATLLVWATRAGGLVAAMMASVPAWRSLDPLPILERKQAVADEDDDVDSAADGTADNAHDGAHDGAPHTPATAPAGAPPARADLRAQAPVQAQAHAQAHAQAREMLQLLETT